MIAWGVLSRRYPQFLPAALGKYPGDALWALMVFLGFGFCLRSSPTLVVALTVLAFSVAIEFSQLYHATWIDSIRATLLGHLILGSGFAWFDMVAYAVGVSIGTIGEFAIFHRSKNKKADPS